MAFVVASERPISLVEIIRSHTSHFLPSYMVPNHYVIVDKFPTNKNGKIDRKILHALPRESHASEATNEPKSDIERMLCQLWAQHLEASSVGIRDDFFELGGDSITAIRIAQGANNLGIRLRPRDILIRRTVEAIAAGHVEMGNVESGTVSTVNYRQSTAIDSEPDEKSPAGRPNRLPLLPGQLNFLKRAVPNYNHWNHAVLYSLKARTTVALVREAANALLSRHPALTCRIVVDDKSAWQTTDDSPAFVEEFYIDCKTEDDIKNAINSIASTQHTQINLQHGPVCRFVLFQIGKANASRLLVIVHHAVVDLVSWDIITSELDASIAEKAARPVEKGADVYCAWANDQTTWFRENFGHIPDNYWISQCSENLPIFGGLSDFGLEGDVVDLCFDLDSTSTEKLLTFAASRGADPFLKVSSSHFHMR